MNFTAITEIKSYMCRWCGKVYDMEEDAAECFFKHARRNYANVLLKRKHSLYKINRRCGFGWNMIYEKKKITKNSCFIIPNWPCSDKPAYQIIGINENGNLRLSGKGTPAGYYEGIISFDNLPEPYPKKELFIYEESDKI